jgi:2-polyprenyl-3-methyl-5-hydroxy-6-metoxy-1,4-benzoquinol methylase
MSTTQAWNRGELPFELDAKVHKGYWYTTGASLSAHQANDRLTQVSSVWIKKLGSRLKSLVDIGCGDGTYTQVLSKMFPSLSISGGDPAPSAIQLAKTNYPKIPFFVCDVLNIRTLKPHKKDGLILRGVIHHVMDPQVAITNACVCAKHILIIEPNGWNPIVKVIEKTSKYHREHGEKSYTSWKLRSWIEHAGGTVQREYYVGLVPFFCPDVVVPMLKAMQPFIEKSPLARFLCGQVVLEVEMKTT